MNLQEAIFRILSESPSRLVLSSPRSQNSSYIRSEITLKQGKTVFYQQANRTRTQVFHENYAPEELPQRLETLLTQSYTQLNAWSLAHEYALRISKKGKVLLQETLSKGAVMTTLNHNRPKKRLLTEGEIIPPLIDMGIFTKDGKIVRSMEDKFRQINRFLEIVDDAVETCGFEEIHVVDFGCGKAYLTFILYYYLTYVKKIRAYMTGLDLKADVIRKCSEAAKKYGYEHLKFEVGDISVYQSDEPVDMVITLHACDTATDYALYHAVQWNSRVILSVPCCQHELNAQIESEGLSALTKYGLLKERFAALATDALRASLLEYSGYKTQVLEFVDFSHTPKNVLIRAVKSNIPPRKREKSLREVESLMEEFHADPALYRLLMQGRQMQDSFLQKRRGKQL